MAATFDHRARFSVAKTIYLLPYWISLREPTRSTPNDERYVEPLRGANLGLTFLARVGFLACYAFSNKITHIICIFWPPKPFANLDQRGSLSIMSWTNKIAIKTFQNALFSSASTITRPNFPLCPRWNNSEFLITKDEAFSLRRRFCSLL